MLPGISWSLPRMTYRQPIIRCYTKSTHLLEGDAARVSRSLPLMTHAGIRLDDPVNVPTCWKVTLPRVSRSLPELTSWNWLISAASVGFCTGGDCNRLTISFHCAFWQYRFGCSQQPGGSCLSALLS